MQKLIKKIDLRVCQGQKVRLYSEIKSYLVKFMIFDINM